MDDPTKPDLAVCEALRTWREERKLSLQKAADLAAISSSYWQDLEQRKKAPSSGVARALFEATGIPAERWLTPDERRRIEHAQLKGREQREKDIAAHAAHTSNDFAGSRDTSGLGG